MAHKQYSARLTSRLDRLSHFDVNVLYTAGENIPLADYLSRHSIKNNGETEVESNANGKDDIEAEEEFVINEIYGLFEIFQTNGSIKRYIERTRPRTKIDQSQHYTHMLTEPKSFA